MKTIALSGIILTLMLIGVALTFNIHPAMATGTIYIRPDGSVEGTDKIQRDGDLYTLTSDITSDSDGIVVERSNTVIDGKGYTVQGMGGQNSKGIGLLEVGNVTVKGVNIRDFYYGILSEWTTGRNTISGNHITNNNYGIRLSMPFGADINGNHITDNINCGISAGRSYANIYGNDIEANGDCGIAIALAGGNIGDNVIADNYAGISLFHSSASISGNDITNNYAGIVLDQTGGDIRGNNIMNNDVGISLGLVDGVNVFHNNFINNPQQVFVENYDWPPYLIHVWDDGFPSGGNYWSDYTARYPSAEEIDDSGIWDTPYVIDENNADNYPLMNPWIQPIAAAATTIDPDTLNLGSRGRWFTAYVQLPEGYDAADVDASTILLNGTIPPVLDPKYGFVTNSSEYLVDNNNDGILERMVKFDGATVKSFIYNEGIRYSSVVLIITGKMLDKTPFEAACVVFVNYAGDVNNDGKINVLDAAAVSACWHPGPPTGLLGYDENADLNKDGTVNILDSGIVNGNWGQTVP